MPKGYATQEYFEIELNKIPDLETFKKQLAELFSLAKTSLSQKEIRKLFFEKAILLPNSVAPLPLSTINLLKVFRVRDIDENKEDLNLIRTFSYPNPCFCDKNGRANLKYKPVFYCADTFETALAENHPTANSTRYLSIWKINSDRDVNYTAFFPSTMPNKNVWYNTAVEYLKQMVEHSKNFGNEKSKQLISLFEFIADTFISETSPYSLTSWIANSMLYESYGIDFIVYPSFAADGKTCNIAFHPNFIDNYFRLEKIYKCEMNEVFEDGGNYTIKKVGKIFLTNIKWEAPSDEDMKEDFPKATKLFNEQNINSQEKKA